MCVDNLFGLDGDGCPVEITPPPSGGVDLVPVWNTLTGCVEWQSIGNLVCDCELDTVNSQLDSIIALLQSQDCNCGSQINLLVSSVTTSINNASNANDQVLSTVNQTVGFWLQPAATDIANILNQQTFILQQLDDLEQCACGTTTDFSDIGVTAACGTYTNPCAVVTITVFNNGPDDAANVLVPIQLDDPAAPSSLNYLGSLPGVTFTIQPHVPGLSNLLISIPNLPNGNTETFTFNACDNGDPDPGAEYIVQVQSSSDSVDNNNTNDTDFCGIDAG